MRRVFLLSATAVAVTFATAAAMAPQHHAASGNVVAEWSPGFYQVDAPKGVDEAFVVVPTRHVAKDGSVMTEVASEDDSDEAFVVTSKPKGVLALIAGVLGR